MVKYNAGNPGGGRQKSTIISGGATNLWLPFAAQGRFLLAALLGIAVLVAGQVNGCGVAYAQDKFIVVASTTSTQDSGLFGHILPLFKAKTGVDVRVVAQGTGQALALARKRRCRCRIRTR